MLLKRGANQRIGTVEGDNPLFLAMSMNFHSLTRKLLNAASVDEKVGRHKQTIMHRLLMHFDEPTCLKFFQKILQVEDCDVNMKNRMRQSPLFYAAHFGYLQILELLKSHKADVFMKDFGGNNVLHFCASAAVANFILDWMNAIASGDVAAAVNHPNSQGNTPLHAACAFGDRTLVQVFIQRGGSIHTKNKLGIPPLQVKFCYRRRVLPFYTHDEEAPYCGGIIIGGVQLAQDELLS